MTFLKAYLIKNRFQKIKLRTAAWKSTAPVCSSSCPHPQKTVVLLLKVFMWFNKEKT